MKKKIIVLICWIILLLNSSSFFVSANFKQNKISIKNGWPYVIEGDMILGPPTLADLDNDGTLEIILSSGKIYVLKHNGVQMDNFPVDLEGLKGGIPSVGDINNDGFLEIIIDNKINNNAYSIIHALSYLGTSIPGWPIQTDGYYSRPILSDIDKDGFLDIIFTGHKTGTQNCYIQVYNRYGYAISGWPRWVSCPEGMGAIGDINNDSFLEIVIGTDWWYENDTGGIYSFDNEGNITDGWPVETGKRFPAPITLADLDNDGDLEIIGSADCGDFNLYIYHHNGTKILEIQNGNGLYYEVVPVDLDGDGDLEIITITGSQVNAFHHNGENVYGWPVVFEGTPNGGGGSANGEPSVVVGDIDNDGESEILMSSMTTTKNLIYAWKSDGSIINGFPIEIIGGPKNTYSNGALALGDLDANGYAEIVFVGYQYSRTDIYVFELDSYYNTFNMQWPQFHHDAQHTGLQKNLNQNSAPNKPKIYGPTNGKVGISYSFTFTSTDPDEDDIAEYIINWGDVTDEEILIGPFASGEEVTASHVWAEKGDYVISAQAKDILGLTGPAGNLPITIPRARLINFNILKNWLLERFPILKFQIFFLFFNSLFLRYNL